mmetsp:Transcript_112205/g.198759  ORF Transcript_112205/g.198759 Transcript_112205/m.198759 type:complete len:738 (+) Transcript_112205:103-2316(+)
MPSNLAQTLPPTLMHVFNVVLETSAGSEYQQTQPSIHSLVIMGKVQILIGSTSAGIFVALCHVIRTRIQKRKDDDGGDCDIWGVLSGHWSFTHWLAVRDCPKLLCLLYHMRCADSWWLSPNAMATKGRWTPLQVASTYGCTSVVSCLISSGAILDAQDIPGHTALAIAVARGHHHIAKCLLDKGASPICTDRKLATPLHLAALRGDADLCRLLLEYASQPDAQDSGGWTPLLVACAKEARWSAAKLLLQKGANASIATYGQMQSALMLVAEWSEFGPEAMRMLLACNADPAAVDTFGQTALHFACRHGHADVVKALCDKGAPISAQDNDGHYPLQSLCECCARSPDNKELVEKTLSAILQVDPKAASHLDFSDSSAVHTLLCLAGIHKTAPLLALKALLDARADATLEDDYGFTAAHYAAALSTPNFEAVMSVLRDCPHVPQQFWTSVDLKKKQDTSNRKYLMRRGGHHRIPLETRTAVLKGDISLTGIAKRITEGRSRDIVVLVGAGASTAAGIPDFRSPMGLWSQAATRDLFSSEGFHARPEEFWRKASELFLDRCPTRTHSFLGRLASKGFLRRVYTQNIDGLEVAAGVPDDLVIECHGSSRRMVCSANRNHVTQIMSKIDMPETWQAPRCTCGALMRPDIVFFGEPLPHEFSLHSGEDLNACDLLIVVGTALNVYPVAGLVNRVSSLTPRLLINREAVGVWRGSDMNAENYRDVMWKGDCEAGAEELMQLLGW